MQTSAITGAFASGKQRDQRAGRIEQEVRNHGRTQTICHDCPNRKDEANNTEGRK